VEHPGAHWITERELRRDAMAAARERGSGRLFDGVPHVPDGVLVLRDGRRVAVEAECTAKGSARYRTILSWYAGGLAFERVRWFVSDERLRDRLIAVVRAERLDDLVSVDALFDSASHGGQPCSVGAQVVGRAATLHAKAPRRAAEDAWSIDGRRTPSRPREW
jgi:hypothetical protein